MSGASASELDVLRDVTACELVALHQARGLAPDAARGPLELQQALDEAFESLEETTSDRPLGVEVSALRSVLGLGWAPPLPWEAAAHRPTDGTSRQ